MYKNSLNLDIKVEENYVKIDYIKHKYSESNGWTQELITIFYYEEILIDIKEWENIITKLLEKINDKFLGTNVTETFVEDLKSFVNNEIMEIRYE